MHVVSAATGEGCRELVEAISTFLTSQRTAVSQDQDDVDARFPVDQTEDTA